MAEHASIRPGRRERLRREMIDEIIAAARLVLEKDGPRAISVRAIARQVGVSSPAIYRYFPSLDALMCAVNECVLSELCAAVESAGEQSGGEQSGGEQPGGEQPGGEQPGGTAGAFRGWALSHPASFRLALGFDGQHAAGRPSLARLLSLSVPQGSLLSWATLCGLVLLELASDRDDLPDDIGQLYDRIEFPCR